MNDLEKSDGCVVPAKPLNNGRLQTTSDHGAPYTGTKAETPDTDKGAPVVRGTGAGVSAEVVEGRHSTRGNTDQQNASRTQSRIQGAPNALDRVREAAKRDKGAKFTALMHHVTIERLRTGFLSLKRKAAPGTDGVTWLQYAEDLEGNLRNLHGRLHRGAYRAKPSRRMFIPKSDGRLRPLGIASLEDKIVQKAVVEVLNAVYEVDFLGFSYGFRPGRSQHQALDALTVGILRKKVNWVLDADIRGFFDAIDHEWLLKFVGHRIGDKRILRLIQKWLVAGVMDNGIWTKSGEGTPQGATVSPLLANVYLHYALDLWTRQWRQRHARGEVIIVRYADDFVVGFQYGGDATKYKRALVERLQQFSLELHPDKTRLLEFGWYAAERRAKRGLGKPETFDFLGFTHICGKARSGRFLLVRKTIRKRFCAKLRQVRDELMRRRHLPVPIQGRWLGQVVRGYLAYHAIPGNTWAIQAFCREVTRHWLHALRRRSQVHRMTWARMNRIASFYIPRARVQHPWPTERFDATTRGRSPVR